ncbi:hypothetical protein [Thermosulfuriphilus sp.]
MELPEIAQLEERLERLLNGFLELKKEKETLERLLKEREAEVARLREERGLFRDKVLALIAKLDQLEREQFPG